MHFTFAEALAGAQAASGRYHVVKERRRLELGMYAPGDRGDQQPHDRDEIYVIAAGTATFTKAGNDVTVQAGDALHVAAYIAHGFSAMSDDFAAWVVFDREPTPRLVPDDVDVPEAVDEAAFRLRPLGPEHNERDHAAWMSSIDHIAATPGFVGWGWPHVMSLDENLADLVMHRSHFDTRAGFTWTVLSPDGPEEEAEVVGCIYLYPDETDRPQLRSWVRADHAHLDRQLHDWLVAWLTSPPWPWTSPDELLTFPR